MSPRTVTEIDLNPVKSAPHCHPSDWPAEMFISADHKHIFSFQVPCGLHACHNDKDITHLPGPIKNTDCNFCNWPGAMICVNKEPYGGKD